jgi:predicted P-loop ATPase
MRGSSDKDAELAAARQAAAKDERSTFVKTLEELRDSGDWQGVLAFNEFTLTVVLKKAPPWCRGSDNCWTERAWTDNDDVLATEWLHLRQVKAPLRQMPSIIEAVARENTFHPVRDYLRGLAWDRKPRIDTFAHVYLRAPEYGKYHSAIARVMFVGSVARIEDPGCKYDYVPILESEQGNGKSTAVSLLYSPWFTDDISDLGTKDSCMQMRGVWGIELSELSAMAKSDVERVKAFITRRTDRFRPAYGRRVIEAPRQSVCMGTTNRLDGYLRDDTGARRFLPIRAGTIDTGGIEADKDQLWAEAVQLYRDDEPWWLAPDMAAEAQVEQELRFDDDVWQSKVYDYVNGKTCVEIPDVLAALGIPTDRQTRAESTRIGSVLRTLKWKRKGRRIPGRDRVSVWIPPEALDV